MIALPPQKIPRFHEAPIGWVRLDDDAAASRRQRCPAHVPASVTPGDPGRRPCTAGYPDPSVALIEIPATIMEGSPAPLPIALVGPAVVCVHPVPAGAVRSEAGSHHRGA